MKFTKMHGAGNDYVYVDARFQNRDWNELSRQMSDRHFGVGGDGLILIKDSDVADLKMSMFNADGSEAEMCGNGIRCFVKYAVDHGIVSDSSISVSVETLAGIRQVSPIAEGGQVVAARVSMGNPILTLSEVPVRLGPAEEYGPGPVLEYPFQIDDHDLPLSFVSMGNPHAVTFTDTPVAEFPLHTVGPRLEHHSIFPNRVNFEIVNIDSRDHLTARVWERGSGETMACGTGACGIAVASILGGYTGNTVDITLPGGTLRVDWDGEGEVFLEGPAQEVFSGEWK